MTIRIGADDEECAVARVAGRDSRPVPPAPHLVAVRDGEIAAVLSLRTGEVVADPFRPTAELVELLRFRAAAEPSRVPGARRGRSPRRGRRVDVGLAGARCGT